jgi:hypothetical protein
MTNRCVCCGVEIPEGRQVCPKCEDTVKCDNCVEWDKMGQTLKKILDREEKRIKG